MPKFFDHFRRFLFWSDQGASGVPAKISRCDMDGSKIKNIVTSDMTDVRHIALDILEQRIYWTAGGQGSVSTATFKQRYIVCSNYHVLV